MRNSDRQEINPDAVRVENPQQLLDILGGWDERFASEPWLEDIDPDTGVLVWTPPTGLEGKQNVLVRVQDGQGGIDLQYFQVEIETPNRAPSFTSAFPEETSLQAGKTFTYQATAIDPDGDTLTYEVIGENAQIDPETGRLQWMPTEIGKAEIIIGVSDGEKQTTQTLSVEVKAPQSNSPPEIVSEAPTRIRLGKTYFYDIKVKDADGDNLTLNLTTPLVNHENIGMSIDERGRIVWTPKAEHFGTHGIEVEVSDGNAIATQQSKSATGMPSQRNNGKLKY